MEFWSSSLDSMGPGTLGAHWAVYMIAVSLLYGVYSSYIFRRFIRTPNGW